MSPAEFALRRPVTIIMVFLSLVSIGLVSARLLPLEFFPAVDVPFIAIQVPYQGSTPEEVEREITRPVEEVLATLSGIKRLDSRSSESGSNIEIIFDWGEDVAIKVNEPVREHDVVARRLSNCVIERVRFSGFGLVQQPERQTIGEALDDRIRVVGGVVVDHEELPLDLWGDV